MVFRTFCTDEPFVDAVNDRMRQVPATTVNRLPVDRYLRYVRSLNKENQF